MKKHVYLLACALPLAGWSQDGQDRPVKPRITFFDGIAVAGYVDRGAYLNFTGPNISMAAGKTKLVLGMLPSLRFKEDRSAVKNSFVTPNLGVGLTCSYRKVAVQIPLYYNAKTATTGGKWHVGAGIGVRLK